MKNQTSPLAPRRQRDYAGVLSSILAILAGLLVGLIVLLATNPSNAFPAFSALITGGFYSGMKTFGKVLYYAVPIIMTGLGVGFGFKASIFNIGGAGQFIVGAFCGVYTASIWNLPGALGWIVPLLASMIGGALWALLPGLLHAYRRVNIVIATIMMNYIGMYGGYGAAAHLLPRTYRCRGLPQKNQSAISTTKAVQRDLRRFFVGRNAKRVEKDALYKKFF